MAPPIFRIYADYTRMLDEVKPDIVFGFLENNRHLCQSRGLPPQGLIRGLMFSAPGVKPPGPP